MVHLINFWFCLKSSVFDNTAFAVLYIVYDNKIVNQHFQASNTKIIMHFFSKYTYINVPIDSY